MLFFGLLHDPHSFDVFDEFRFLYPVEYDPIDFVRKGEFIQFDFCTEDIIEMDIISFQCKVYVRTCCMISICPRTKKYDIRDLIVPARYGNDGLKILFQQTVFPVFGYSTGGLFFGLLFLQLLFQCLKQVEAFFFTLAPPGIRLFTHIFSDSVLPQEMTADGLVVVHFVDHFREQVRHGDHPDLVALLLKGDAVGDDHLVDG